MLDMGLSTPLSLDVRKKTLKWIYIDNGKLKIRLELASEKKARKNGNICIGSAEATKVHLKIQGELFLELKNHRIMLQTNKLRWFILSFVDEMLERFLKLSKKCNSI